MQKLLRRNPSSFILYTGGSPSFSPLAFTNTKSFISLNSKNPPTNSCSVSSSTSLLSMPSASVFPGNSALAIAFKKKPICAISSRFASSSCCACGCFIQNRAPFRAWIVCRSGCRTAWLHTVSDGSVSVSAVEGTKEYNMGMDVHVVEKGGKNEKGIQDKPLTLSRRQRGLSSAGDFIGNPDLLTIPGVGPRNLRKLVEKGIAGVAELKKLYKDKLFGNSGQKMVEFLQSSVGIIHRNHAESITTYIKESVDEELEEGSPDLDGKLTQKKRLTFCVEGNISVGKTTFLQRIANETLELQDLVEIVPEPINKWQDIGPDHFNILDAFYAEPQRYAYTFQNYVFVTRVMQERESSCGIKPLRLMERSVFSDRMVFVRAVHEANWMNEMEISIYDSWFDPVVSCLPGLIPDGFIYLRASPDTCHKRMKLRKITEEGGVSLDYLHGLHEKHESWLFPFESGNHGILSVSEPLHMDKSLHPDIRDRVFYLQGDHMHSSIQKVPALVLDCEPNIDFNRDIEAKKQYAQQVAGFFEYVKKKKEVSLRKDSKTENSSQPQIMFPHKGGLWVPDKHFSESALKSLDFRRTISIMSG